MAAVVRLLPPIQQLFARINHRLARINHRLPFVGDPVAFVCDPFSFVGDATALFGTLTVPLRGSFPALRRPLADTGSSLAFPLLVSASVPRCPFQSVRFRSPPRDDSYLRDRDAERAARAEAANGASSSFIGCMGFAVETVVHTLEGAVAQLLGREGHVLEGQMVPERVVSQFDAGVIMISGAFLAHLQLLFGHRFHAVGIPTDRGSGVRERKATDQLESRLFSEPGCLYVDVLRAGRQSQERRLYRVPVKSLEEAPEFDFRAYDRLDAGGYLDQIRQQSAVVRVPGGAMVLGHDEVQKLLSDRSLRSPVRTFLEMQGVTGGLVHQRLGQTLLAIDGPDHDRIRSIVRKAFVPSAVVRYRPVMHSVVAGLVEPLRAAGGCEFMAHVADHYPIRVMCHVLGVPDEDHDRFAAWISGIGWALTTELAAHRDEIESSMSALDEYVGELLADRRARPQDDLVSELSVMEQQGDRLSEDELRSLIIGLLFAGHDTTRNQLGLAVWLFARHPDQWKLLANEPEYVNNAVEEVMRFLGSVAVAPRLTAEAMELDGYIIPAGTLLMLSTASANHDPCAFTNPHSFDVTATRAPQLTFGGGPHYCLGAHLARAEMAEALKVLPSAFRNLRLNGQPDWRAPMNIWGPERLPVSYDSQPS